MVDEFGMFATTIKERVDVNNLATPLAKPRPCFIVERLDALTGKSSGDTLGNKLLSALQLWGASRMERFLMLKMLVEVPAA
jgi:hypothetical protein